MAMQKVSLLLCFFLCQFACSLNVGKLLRPLQQTPAKTDSFRIFASENGEAVKEAEEDISAKFNVLVEDLDAEEDDQEVILSPGKPINGYTMPTGKKIVYSAYLERKPAWWQTLKTRGEMLKSRGDMDEELNEDGYAEMHQGKRSFFKSVLKFPLKVASKVLSLKPVEPGTLILVRHGESEWNKNKTFTGWADPDLTDQGRREIEHAARLLMAGGYKIDVVFTSRLKRAIRSVWILLQELNEVYLPVFKSWRLNERMYGALTGLSKQETAERLGQELVQEWRGSLRSRPPPLQPKDTYWPGRDRRYADLTNEQIPLTESLLDCMERTTPLWENKIKYELSRGRNVLVVAHANTLRGLVKTIDNIGDAEIQGAYDLSYH
jgi:2,3-bisphosphoglycerate-dependent phosphoglycerate mutase